VKRALLALVALLSTGCTQLTDSDLGRTRRREAAQAFGARFDVLRSEVSEEHGLMISEGGPDVDELLWLAPFVAGETIDVELRAPGAVRLLWEIEDADERLSIRPIEVGERLGITLDVSRIGAQFGPTPRTVCLAAEDARGLHGTPLCVPIFGSETPAPIVRPRILRMFSQRERLETIDVVDGRVYAGSSGGNLAILGDIVPPVRFEGHAGVVFDLDADAEGFVSAGADEVRVWSRGGLLQEVRPHPGVRAVLRRGELVCSAGHDATLRCGDRQRAFDERIEVMDTDLSGERLVLGLGRIPFPGQVLVVDTETLEVVASRDTEGLVTAIDFDGVRVAAASGRGVVEVYDASLAPLLRVEELGGGIDDLVLRGDLLLALTFDGVLVGWDLATGSQIARFENGVEGFAFEIVEAEAFVGTIRGELWRFDLQEALDR